MHDDSSDDLLADEVSDLNLEQTSLGVLVHIYVDGEMCVDVSHLVLEALGDANDQVVDEGANCAEGSDVLAGTVVQLDLDNILLGVREVDGQMVQVLGELASRSFDGDKSRLDGDLDTLGDVQGLGGMNVLHCVGGIGWESREIRSFVVQIKLEGFDKLSYCAELVKVGHVSETPQIYLLYSPSTSTFYPFKVSG